MVRKGTTLSQETKDAISKSVKQAFKEHPEIITNGVKKWKKFFNTEKGKKGWQQTNKKRSDSAIGKKKKPFTEEHKKNISLATKRQYKIMFPWGRRKSSKVHLKFKKELKKFCKCFKSEQFIRLADIQKWVCIDELDRKNKIAIFVDGEHWHARNYKDDYIVPLINKSSKEVRDYDKLVTEKLVIKGYKVLRFWDSEIHNDIDDCVKRVLKVTN